jgi:hypothetical protein
LLQVGESEVVTVTTSKLVEAKDSFVELAGQLKEEVGLILFFIVLF